MNAAPSPALAAPCYAVALFPGEGADVREVRVLVLGLFGAPSPEEAIGAEVQEVDANGVPRLGREFVAFLPIQRLVLARKNQAGARVVPRAELEDKRRAYAERLAAGPVALGVHGYARRKPRLLDIPEPEPLPEPELEHSPEPSPECLSWLAEHEARQEVAA